jgi:hypothetical protein
MSYITFRGHWCNIIVLNVNAPCEDKGDEIKESCYKELGHVFDQFPRYCMKTLLGDFNVNIGSENTFKPTIRNESLHEISNDNGVRVVKFATSKYLAAKSTMYLQWKICKYTWISPEGKTHNQIDHVLIDRRRHSSILDVRYFRGADHDTDNYLVVAKVRERSNVKKLTKGDVKEEYQVTMRNMFAALENLEDSGDINRAGDNIRENIKISAQQSLGYCEPKHGKPWSDEECSKLVDQRKQAQLQWLQDPSEANEDTLCVVMRQASRNFRNKKREYLKDKIKEIESNNKNKNIRDL